MNKQYIFITREQLGSLDFEEITTPLNDFIWSKDSSETFYTFTDIPNCIQNIITQYNNKLYSPEDAMIYIQEKFNG